MATDPDRAEESLDPAQISAAYEPFAQTLRQGGFGEPASGWNAAQIGAHILINNDLLAGLADRRRAGEEVAYDNSPVVDDEQLLACAGRFNSLDELAAAVLQSAERLAVAYGRLSDADRARPVPAVIRDGGQVVRDGPMLLGDLVAGNADFHLAMHHEQLQALRPQ